MKNFESTWTNMSGGVETLTVVDMVLGEIRVFSTEANTNFHKIFEAVRNDDREAYNAATNERGSLVDEIQSAFEGLSNDFSVVGNTAYFKDFELPENMANFFLEADLNDGKVASSTVKFLNKLYKVPEGSRAQLFNFIAANKIQINSNGDMIFYKTVNAGSDTDYASVAMGFSIVDGVEQNGVSRFNRGSVVEMPREMVTYDPNIHCSTGLHVATWDYAYKGPVSAQIVIVVVVSPEWVVSVPHDYQAQKVRVCKYRASDLEVTEPLAGVFSEIGYDEAMEDVVPGSSEGSEEFGYDSSDEALQGEQMSAYFSKGGLIDTDEGDEDDVDDDDDYWIYNYDDDDDEEEVSDEDSDEDEEEEDSELPENVRGLIRFVGLK